MNRTQLLAFASLAASLSVVAGFFLLPHGPAPIDPRKARDEAEAKCSGNAPDPESCALAGSVRLYAHDLEGAKERAAKGLAADPKNLHVLLLDAALSAASGDLPGAKEKYLAAEKIHPESALPAANMTNQALQAGDLPGAEEAVERALKIDPKLSLAHTMKARVLEAKGLPDDAIHELDLAIAADPVALDARLEMADLFGRQGKYDERLAVLKETVRLAPKDVAVRIGLGQSYELTGDLDSAASELRKAAELAPHEPLVDLALGRVYLEQGKADFALARLKAAHEGMHDDIEPKLLLASALFGTGARDEAIAFLDEVLATKDAPPGALLRAHRQRAQIEARLGNWNEALADAAGPLAADASDGEMNALAAHVLIELKRYDEAAKHLDAAAAAGAKSGAMLLDRARVLAQQGQKEKALDALEELSRSTDWDAQEVRAQSELAPLLEEPRFRLLLEKK